MSFFVVVCFSCVIYDSAVQCFLNTLPTVVCDVWINSKFVSSCAVHTVRAATVEERVDTNGIGKYFISNGTVIFFKCLLKACTVFESNMFGYLLPAFWTKASFFFPVKWMKCSKMFRKSTSLCMNHQDIWPLSCKWEWLIIFSINEDSHPERNEAALSTVVEGEMRASNTCRGERGLI